MSMSLVPRWWRRGSLSTPEHPFAALHHDLDEMFDDLARPWSNADDSRWGYFPRVDVRETDSTMEVSAELPGLQERDVDVTLSPDGKAMTIRGEKTHERQSEGSDFHRIERTYGRFNRMVSLPCAASHDDVSAILKNGVLTVTLNKSHNGNGVKPIAVKAG